MNLINLIFLLFVIKAINACSLNCVEFLDQESGRYHSNCAFTTIGNASRCYLENFNQELIDAGITQRISTVNLKFNFNSYVTVIYLKLISTPSQKLIVQPERDHYEVTTFYLVGRFEFPDQNVLRRFPNVQLLVLQGAYFPSGIPSFTELRHLTHIYSDKTEIGGSDLVITENFVSGLPDLEHLFFRTENTDRITFENENVFRQLNVLTYLNLKRVSFNSVPLDLLNPLVNLKILRVSSAFISNLTFLENSGLTNIEEINLALNRINSLKPFGNFPKLTELALFSNEVSYFDSPDLKGLKTLKELDLDSNRIGYLSIDIFSELRDLQTLKLLRNQLRTLSPEHIQHLRDLKSVDLRLNKIVCDCDLAWVSQVSDKYGLEFQGECTVTNEDNAITEQSNYASCTSPTFSLECFNRSNICRENSRCVGYANTFLCPCNNGFEEENGTCVDIDECERGIAQCEHHCSNLPGSYECCLPGFRIDSEGRCVDLNECFDTILNDCTEICENTVGSYNCACDQGYELSADGRSCRDIDECSSSNQDCSYKCKNDVGGYHCECPVGYQLDRDGKRCIDNTSCHYLHAECDRYCQVNTGRFECVCGEGYIREIVGSVERCANIDECKIPQICSQGCEDSDGGYSCLCDPGSRLGPDNKTCVDIDECREGKPKCTVLELCVNIENSYDCVCKHDHNIEGTDQCGFVPVYAYYVTGGVLLALALLVILILSLLICLFVYRRKQKKKENRRMNKQIYKEVSLQRTERHVTAYDPLNELENSDSSPARDSICDTPDANKYTKMYPINAENNVYDSIKEIAADNEAVST